MLVENVMTTPVLSVKSSAPLKDAVAMMLAQGISGLPVVDEAGALAGMVTEGDLLRRGELNTEKKRPRWIEFLRGPGAAADAFVQSHGRTAGEVMTGQPVTIGPKAALGEAVDLMMRRRIKRLPVVQDGRIVGIVARSDLVRALARMLPEAKPPESSDDVIRRSIEAQLGEQSWAGNDMIRVHVDHGVVELSGMLLDERARLAAKVLAENTPGVTRVDDQLVWVEPMSGTVILPGGEVAGPPRPIGA
jgi:CBS domain-containing protein